ncbi:hypothetical protein IJH89_01275 [Candidatus Saccharibacteria bacterium]|nr:hypothetical protein [Candidatus Saccharibacteria bacterium]
MTEAVLIAIITGSVTLAGNLIANHSARKKDAIERARRDQEFKDKLDILEKKVDEHNGYAKRFGEIEKAIVRIDTTLSERFNKAEKKI